MDKIPVHIITGFLGAGKTTFLNHWIKSQAEERLLVIENEVGAVNIDSRLVMGLPEEVIELTAGCLCCSLNGDLLNVLEEVSYRRQEFDRLVIETTGVADPETIVFPFLLSAGVGRVFDLQQVICLVDAENIEDWLANTEEARRQIAFADVLLINKIDAVAESYQASLRDLLAGINPYAHVFLASQGQFPVADILPIQKIEGVGVVAQTSLINPDHQQHKHGISTFTITFDRPFDLQGLGHTLVQLLTINRHQIYRIKGLIDADGYPVQVVLQSVLNNFCLTDGLPWPKGIPKESKIVVIGKELQKAAIERVFRRHLR